MYEFELFWKYMYSQKLKKKWLQNLKIEKKMVK